MTGAINADTRFDQSDFRNIVPRFSSSARKANQALVDLLGEIAAAKTVTPAQIALAWLLAQRPWIVPIPGTTKLPHLAETIGAADVTLTPDDLAAIANVLAKVAVQGVIAIRPISRPGAAVEHYLANVAGGKALLAPSSVCKSEH